MNPVRKINRLLSVALLSYIGSVQAIKSTSAHVEVQYTIWKSLTQKTSGKNAYKG